MNKYDETTLENTDEGKKETAEEKWNQGAGGPKPEERSEKSGMEGNVLLKKELPTRRMHYVRLMLTGFGTIALSIILYFMIARNEQIAAGIKRLLLIIRPFLIGGVFAYLLRPFCSFVENSLNIIRPEKKKFPITGIAITVSLLMAVMVIYLLLIAVIPQLIASLTSLMRQLSAIDTQQYIDRIEAYFHDNQVISNYLETFYDEAEAWVRNYVNQDVLPLLRGLVTDIGSGIADVFDIFMDILVGIIVAIYLLQGRKRFSEQGRLVLNSIFPEKQARIILEEIHFADKVFNGFLGGKVLDSAIIGAICYIFCLIARIPNAMLVSVIVGVTNIIPFFGPYIGAVPSVLIILVSSRTAAVVFLIFLIVLQQVDGNIIGPRILGNSTGLSGFFVLFAILFFGGIWGLFGMIVGVPLFAVIYDIIKKLVRWRLEKSGRTAMLENYNRKWHE